jgi:hypothetical protein
MCTIDKYAATRKPYSFEHSYLMIAIDTYLDNVASIEVHQIHQAASASVCAYVHNSTVNDCESASCLQAQSSSAICAHSAMHHVAAQSVHWLAATQESINFSSAAAIVGTTKRRASPGTHLSVKQSTVENANVTYTTIDDS